MTLDLSPSRPLHMPMPATPAWPPSSLPRLYVDGSLTLGQRIIVEGPQANYLGTVLRLGQGARLKLFDDVSGEWLAAIAEPGRRRLTLEVMGHLRDRETVPDVWLLFAPIKRGRIDWLVEKATELGAAKLVPIRTQRTIVDRLNLARLRAHMIEAAEQCERTALPVLGDIEELGSLLLHWPSDRRLLFADEGGGTPLAEAAAPGPAAIMIGPEGGFTDEERTAIGRLPQAMPVSLGPRILRADTAAVAALSLWMAACGDWRSHAVR